MPRFAALLGSINVGGNRLKMADLKVALEEAEFSRIKTVGASGNVLFDAEEERGALEAQLADLLLHEFDIDSFAVVRSREELEATLAECPFADSGEPKLVHITFLDRRPDAGQVERLMADHAGRGQERVAMGAHALHIDYVDGVARSKLTKPFIESRLGCRGTARNINSLKTIIGSFD